MLLWHDLEHGQGLKYAYQPDGSPWHVEQREEPD